MVRADLYHLLIQVASQSDPRISYGDVSRQLADHPDPHTGLSAPLCELNCECKKAGLPPISAVVVQKDENGQLGIPGAGFWNCPAVAANPRGGIQQLEEWLILLKQVRNANWPDSIPGLE